MYSMTDISFLNSDLRSQLAQGLITIEEAIKLHEMEIRDAKKK